MLDVDDLLGPAAPQAAPPKKRARKPKVEDLLGPARKAGVRKYEPLKAPRAPAPGGIFAAREAKGKNLGKTCLICTVDLKPKRGRPPVICRKDACFRAYRNLYRHDYDRLRAS